ncbi:hypothetical protein AB0M39_00565 [Streptomyces sp. NPDC051907]|uniref:hypothetical protein n=1 Tax=Streptomyces sp. NPDC051907 TaxID=3155284 RepID=UPI0034327E17
MTNSAASDGDRRFLDPGAPLAAYADLVHAVCPQCGGRAAIVPRPGLPELRYTIELHYRPRRLTCALCGAVREWTAGRRDGALVPATLGGPHDPFFGRPLWLQTPCCGEVLWAYNERHLDALGAYIAAGLRERTGCLTMCMLDRLPAWMKAAGHRAEVLRAVDRLRAQAARTDPRHRPAVASEGPAAVPARPVRALYFREPY